MIARVNFTSRKRILREQIQLTVDITHDPPVADVAVEMPAPVPPDAAVVLEAYRHARTARFSLGTAQQAATIQQVTLPREFGALARFRLKVFDPRSDLPSLLAHADRLAPTVITPQGKRRSLLDVDPVDLGNQVWRIEFELDRPVLQVNKRIPGIMNRVRSDAKFGALVFPAALRHILTHFLIDEHAELDGDDDDSFPGKWLRFASAVAAAPPPEFVDNEDPSDALAWIERAVEHFARRHAARSRYAEAV